ncbi:MAG TPA: DUF2795 domain-containing protein [Ktedonobacterales bacterium]
MSVYSPVLLDIASSLRDAVTTLFNDLFSFQSAVIALALAFGLAILGWLIAYFILRHKEVCSMVCSIHFLTVILTIIAGMIGALGLIDQNKGSLITGAGLALLVLTLPIFILVESFNYVVLSNKHARHHRDLRTPADKRVRRTVVFLTPLLIGLILVGVGVLVGTAVGPVTEVIILLLTLWVLALGAEIIFLARSRQRRSKLAAMPGGSSLDQQQLAALWVSGIGSYRIGRGRTEAIYWEEFTERVVVTEELLLEEEGELDLVEVEEQESFSYETVGVAGGAAVAAGPALHRQHRLKRHAPAHRFRRRWGSVVTLFVLFIVALIVCAVTSVSTLIALAFLAPVIYLVFYRVRRDNDVRFATETVEKINSVQAATVVAGSRGGVAVAEAAAPAPARPASANPPGLRPARPTPVIPPATPPLILPKEEPEPPTLPSVEVAEQASQEAVASGAAHENPDIADETVLFPGRAAAVAAAAAAAAGAAHENPDIADDTLLIAHAPATPQVDEELSGEQFGSYFQGVTFPANRSHLLEHARRNHAPHFLILWLEALAGGVTIISLVELRRRYRARHSKSAKVSSTIGIIEFQRYLRGVDYPATKEQLLAQARQNNAPPNMMARLEELEEHYQFLNVSDVMLGYAYHRYLRGLRFPATQEQVLEHARQNNAPAKLLTRLEALEAGATFASLEEVLRRSHAGHNVEEVEVEEDEEETLPPASMAAATQESEEVSQSQVEEAEEPTLPPPPRARSGRISRSIGIIAFQHYLHGVDYPATKEHLLAQARQNEAPPNMIARLEELEENYRFLNVSDVMLGYAYHRYLRGVQYPATKAQLLEHARSNNAAPKLITRLEALDDQATFASLEEVLRRSHAGQAVEEVEEEEEEEDSEAEEETLPPTPDLAPTEAEAPKADSSIRITEFQHHLRGVHYPATRDELLAKARENEAPPNMIARLEELPEHHHFKSASEVMRGYAHQVEDDKQ